MTTNVCTLGSVYTVSDRNGNVLNTVQVISHKDILNAACGEFTAEFKSIKDYLDQSIAALSGFENIDPYKVLWFSTKAEEVVLADIISLALQNGYDKIIVEHLEDVE